MIALIGQFCSTGPSINGKLQNFFFLHFASFASLLYPLVLSVSASELGNPPCFSDMVVKPWLGVLNDS